MAIRRNFLSDNPEYVRLMRKSDQESEMGSMAHSDGDKVDADRHFQKSREYAEQARELLASLG